MKKALIFIIAVVVLVVVAVSVQRAIIAPPEDEEVMVYFSRMGEEDSVIPLSRTIPPTRAPAEKIRRAMEFLLEGPSREETEAGFYSALPADSGLRNVTIERGTVILDFDPLIETGGGTAAMTQRLAQIVYTATQLPRYEEVRLLIDGEEIDYFSGEGLTQVERPMSRRDFPYRENDLEENR